MCGPKLGHTGTLDSFAEGLLVVLVGKMTRFTGLVTDLDKVYEAVICFGAETNTLDPLGKVIRTAPIPSIEKLSAELAGFKGSILQSPPEFSAVHVEGKRAYERALAGEILTLPAREVVIHSVEILSWQLPEVRLRIHCSKGTYIRSFARDWAKSCGSAGFVRSLKRLSVGPFHLKDAVDGQDFLVEKNLWSPQRFLETLKFPLLVTDREDHIKNGKPLEELWPNAVDQKDGTWALVNPEGKLLAAISHVSGKFSYQFVI